MFSNMDTGFKYLDDLTKRGFSVKRLAEYHFRINERFDVFPTFRRFVWSWHDIATNNRGRVGQDKLATFIPQWISEHQVAAPAPKPYIELPARGWWNCFVEGCDFKCRDDMTSESARKIREHAESHE